MRTTDANLYHLYIHLKPGRRELWLSRETKSQLIRDRSDETSDENTVYRKPNLLPTNFFDIVPDAEMMKWYQKALAMNKNANIIIVPTKAQLEGQHHLRWRQGQKESCWISLSKQ